MDKTQILNELKRYKNFVSDADFARFLGINEQNLYVWKKRGTFKLDILVDKFPEVEKYWLITGEGEMLRANVSVHVAGNKNQVIQGVTGNVEAKQTNYNGLSREDLISMIEERFQHMLKKEDQIEQIFEENRKLTDEVIRQNADFRLYNDAYRRQVERIAELTDKLLNKD